MAAHNDFGRQAEDRAADYLADRAWTVLHRNWRWRRREVDLVARRGDVVAFVEVRARASTRYGHPAETVGWRKRRALAEAASAWAQQHGRPRDVYRFDVVTAVGDGPIEHVEGAWTL